MAYRDNGRTAWSAFVYESHLTEDATGCDRFIDNTTAHDPQIALLNNVESVTLIALAEQNVARADLANIADHAKPRSLLLIQARKGAVAVRRLGHARTGRAARPSAAGLAQAGAGRPAHVRASRLAQAEASSSKATLST